jgi:hypothetical protein
LFVCWTATLGIATRQKVQMNSRSHPRILDDAAFAALHPRFKWMRDYLARVAPPSRLPGRQHIDPPAMKDVLPFINLVEVVGSGTAMRFRFRLVGTAQTEAAGREITGMFVEDAVVPESVDRIVGNMRTAIELKSPIYDRFPMAHPNREFIESERVYFPVATDGRTVDMLLLVHAYPDGEGTSKHPEPQA